MTITQQVRFVCEDKEEFERLKAKATKLRIILLERKEKQMFAKLSTFSKRDKDKFIAEVNKMWSEMTDEEIDIEFNSTDIIRQNRSSQMEISFRLKWNKDYLRSLWTALDAVSYRGPNPVSSIRVNSGSIFGFGGQARFDDMQKLRMAASAFVGTTPAILATVRGRNFQPLYSSCFFYQELDHFHRYNITEQRFVKFSATTAYVNGAYKMKSRIQIPINPSLLNQVTSVDLDVVPNKSCPNPMQ
jgi:hypothetical protein